jgi:hypothetical protein
MGDTASGKPTAEIRLPGYPESFQLEHGGSRIFETRIPRMS